MVAMAMRDDGALDRPPGVDVEISLRAIQATASCDDQIHSCLDGKTTQRPEAIADVGQIKPWLRSRLSKVKSLLRRPALALAAVEPVEKASRVALDRSALCGSIPSKVRKAVARRGLPLSLPAFRMKKSQYRKLNGQASAPAFSLGS